jgi:hypothetical protein
MKADDFSPTALADLRARIQSTNGLEAFDRLVQYAIDSQILHCAPGTQARVRDFRYTSVNPRGWPFSFTVSRAHVLFSIRPLGVRTLRLTKTVLSRRIEVVRPRGGGGLQIVVRNRQEADAVVEQVLSRWPAGAASGDSAAVQLRSEMAEFRVNVEQIEGICRVTGVLDRRHIRPVHIKPWESCGKQERLDGNNGLMLSPHVAHLFERGYISFADDGLLLVARQLNSTVLKRWGITTAIPAQRFGARQKGFLAWHRQHVFEVTEVGRRRKV